MDVWGRRSLRNCTRWTRLDEAPVALNLRVLGSIPRRLKSFPEQIHKSCSRDVIVEWFWLRGGCVWLRRSIVEAIDGGAIGTGDQVSVRVDGDLNAAVSELLFHVDDGLALLQQQ